MSSLTRSKPSFIIYRDEPVAGGQTQQSTMQPSTTVTSPRLTISTSVSSALSLKDKENAVPYSAVDKAGKNKAPKLTRSLSAPTSPVMPGNDDGAKAIRQALATKFVAAPTKSSKSKASSSESSAANKLKSKSKSSSSSKRAVATTTSSSSDATASTTTVAAPKLKRSSTSPSPSSSQKKRPTRKASLLAPLPEEGSGGVAEPDATACGSDGLTMADRKARDLTQLPLGDISEAFPTSPIPEGFTKSIAAGVSRKRTRAHSINARDDQATSVTVESISSSSLLVVAEPAPSSTQSTAVVSNASPHKRVRLSPLVEAAELPPVSPLTFSAELPVTSTQETTVEDIQDELDVEATLIDFAMEGPTASS